MTPDHVQTLLDKLRGVRPSGPTGRQWECLCPAHDDSHASLGVAQTDAGVVLLNCFGGCKPADICAAIGLELRDLFPGRQQREDAKGVTIARLAFEKRLPYEWLKEYCGLSDTPAREVEIPYRDEAGEFLFQRLRTGLKGKKNFLQPRGVPLHLYGLWLLAEFRRRDPSTLLFVEGESDCWALWLHGFNALGVPGAAAEKAIKLEHVAGFGRVVVWREPGAAGSQFPGRLAGRLRDVGYQGPVLGVGLDGAKDPSDIQARQGPAFPAVFRGVLAAAAPVEPGAADPAAAAGDPLPQTVRRMEQRLRDAGRCEWGEFEFTDDGNVGRLEKLHGADLRYVGEWKQWFVWDGRRWQADHSGEIFRRASATALSLAIEAQAAPGRDGMRACLAWFEKSQSGRAIETLARLARTAGLIPVGHDLFDRRPMLFNCPNGTIDLCSGTLTRHNRDDYLTALCPTEFEPDADCPSWLAFLRRVFPSDVGRTDDAEPGHDPNDGGNTDLIAFVQRLLGYCMTGVTSVNAMPIFWGSGANGKSTLLDVVQDVIGGSYAMSAPDGFLMSRNSEQHPTELADLFGKRLVVVAETQQNRRLDEALVKRLTGGDKLRARRMRENFWEFDPTHKLILCTNHRPQVRGTDPGIWRRLLLVPFAVRFWDPDKKEKGPEHLKQDKELKAKLRSEAKGILAWLVRGALDWQKSGIEQPAEVREMTSEYRGEEDTLGRFLEERYARTSEGGVWLKDLHADLVRWTEVNRERCSFTSRTLAAELRARKLVVRPSTGNQKKVIGLEPVETTRNPNEVPY